MLIPIFRLRHHEFADAVVKKLGKGREHAGILYREWFREGTLLGEDPAFSNAPRLREAIVSLIDRSVPPLSRLHEEGKTKKFLLSVTGDLETESVVIPMQSGWTLCLSSQVGCRMGCAFCETGKMGLLKNLQAEEIVAQVWIAKYQLCTPIRNLVFMGMGEPLDNYEEVMRAVAVLTDPLGMGFSQRNLTISTSGRVAEIYRLIEEADPCLNLAVSVNASNDAVRRKLMPINSIHDMGALQQAMIAYCSHPRRQILIEYVLIEDINDQLEHARELVTYLQPIRTRCKVNLIPYNPQRRDRFQTSSHEQIDAFAAILREAAYRVLVRGAKGQQIMAACGQLGNRARRHVQRAVSK